MEGEPQLTLGMLQAVIDAEMRSIRIQLASETAAVRLHTDDEVAAIRATVAAKHLHFEGSLVNLRELLSTAAESSNRAVAKADAASEKRFEGINEFRAALSDQQRNLLPRAEAEAHFKAIDEKIEALIKRAEREQGRSIGASALWGYIMGGLGMLLLILHFILSMKGK